MKKKNLHQFSTVFGFLLLLSFLGCPPRTHTVTLNFPLFHEVAPIRSDVIVSLKIGEITCSFTLTDKDKPTGSCPNIPLGTHPYTVEYIHNKSGVIIAMATGTMTIQTGDNIVTIPQLNTTMDDDADRFANLQEILAGTNPKISDFNLSVVKSGDGGGTIISVPSGVTCGTDCSELFASSTMVILTATPDAGVIFTGWSDGGCSGRSTCTVIMTQAHNVTATFILMSVQKVVNKSPLNFSYFKDGQDPNLGSVLSEDQQREGLNLLAGYTDWVRGFGTNFGQDKFCGIAKSMGLKVVASAWLGQNLTLNEAEITRIISIANDCRPEIVVVGSEVLLRNDLTEAQLLAYINRVRAAVPPGIPVTTAEIASALWSHPAVMDAVDVIFANFYPYWEGVNLNVAVQAVNADYEYTVELAKGKQVFVSEVGWPSCGDKIGEAVPSLPNAEFYFKNVMSWAKAKKITVFYFEAFDESWKAKLEGPQGACWGLWTKEGVLKPGMYETFAGDLLPASNWEYEKVVGGPGASTIQFTSVPCFNTFNNLVGRVMHINPRQYRVAVYIQIGGGWWTKPTFSQPLTNIGYDGVFTADITTGGVDQQANAISAYLVPEGYLPPTMSGGAVFPQELNSNAIASVIIERGTSCPVVIP